MIQKKFYIPQKLLKFIPKSSKMPESRPCIAVNARLLLPGRMEGITRFADEILKRLVRLYPDWRFLFLFDRPFSDEFIYAENVEPRVVFPPARHPILWYSWFHLQLPRILRQHQAQLLFSPEFYLSPPAKIPQIGVFHDLGYEHFPKDLDPWAGRYCRKYSPIYAKTAAHILTVSEYSKLDIQQTYATEEEKITVVYNGVSPAFTDDIRPIGEIREKFTEGKAYFLFVGTIQPRKNLSTLFKAFDKFKERDRSDIQLLIVGKEGWKTASAMASFGEMKHQDSVKFSGFIPDEELPSVYQAALALCFVPILEGFGIPVLEAMQASCPVICSNTTALPEVAGDGALLVDPLNMVEIADAMQKVSEDKALRSALIIKGNSQWRKFSWDDSAQQVGKLIEQYL